MITNNEDPNEEDEGALEEASEEVLGPEDEIRYNEKLQEMKNYLPTLQLLMARCSKEDTQDSSGTLKKLKSFYEMFQRPKKKLTLASLRRCEIILKNLTEKIKVPKKSSESPNSREHQQTTGLIKSKHQPGSNQLDTTKQQPRKGLAITKTTADGSFQTRRKHPQITFGSSQRSVTKGSFGFVTKNKQDFYNNDSNESPVPRRIVQPGFLHTGNALVRNPVVTFKTSSVGPDSPVQKRIGGPNQHAQPMNYGWNPEGPGSQRDLRYTLEEKKLEKIAQNLKLMRTFRRECSTTEVSMPSKETPIIQELRKCISSNTSTSSNLNFRSSLSSGFKDSDTHEKDEDTMNLEKSTRNLEFLMQNRLASIGKNNSSGKEQDIKRTKITMNSLTNENAIETNNPFSSTIDEMMSNLNTGIKMNRTLTVSNNKHTQENESKISKPLFNESDTADIHRRVNQLLLESKTSYITSPKSQGTMPLKDSCHSQDYFWENGSEKSSSNSSRDGHVPQSTDKWKSNFDACDRLKPEDTNTSKERTAVKTKETFHETKEMNVYKIEESNSSQDNSNDKISNLLAFCKAQCDKSFSEGLDSERVRKSNILSLPFPMEHSGIYLNVNQKVHEGEQKEVGSHFQRHMSEDKLVTKPINSICSRVSTEVSNQAGSSQVEESVNSNQVDCYKSAEESSANPASSFIVVEEGSRANQSSKPKLPDEKSKLDLRSKLCNEISTLHKVGSSFPKIPKRSQSKDINRDKMMNPYQIASLKRGTLIDLNLTQDGNSQRPVFKPKNRLAHSNVPTHGQVSNPINTVVSYNESIDPTTQTDANDIISKLSENDLKKLINENIGDLPNPPNLPFFNSPVIYNSNLSNQSNQVCTFNTNSNTRLINLHAKNVIINNITVRPSELNNTMSNSLTCQQSPLPNAFLPSSQGNDYWRNNVSKNDPRRDHSNISVSNIYTTNQNFENANNTFVNTSDFLQSHSEMPTYSTSKKIDTQNSNKCESAQTPFGVTSYNPPTLHTDPLMSPCYDGSTTPDPYRHTSSLQENFEKQEGSYNTLPTTQEATQRLPLLETSPSIHYERDIAQRPSVFGPSFLGTPPSQHERDTFQTNSDNQQLRPSDPRSKRTFSDTLYGSWRSENNVDNRRFDHPQFSPLDKTVSYYDRVVDNRKKTRWSRDQYDQRSRDYDNMYHKNNAIPVRSLYSEPDAVRRLSARDPRRKSIDDHSDRNEGLLKPTCNTDLKSHDSDQFGRYSRQDSWIREKTPQRDRGRSREQSYSSERFTSRGRERSSSRRREYSPPREKSHYWKTEEYSGKNSRSDKSYKDTYTSPLDDLYSGMTTPKTGLGYGPQKYRIPKLNKNFTDRSVMKHSVKEKTEHNFEQEKSCLSAKVSDNINSNTDTNMDVSNNQDLTDSSEEVGVLKDSDGLTVEITSDNTENENVESKNNELHKIPDTIIVENPDCKQNTESKHELEVSESDSSKMEYADQAEAKSNNEESPPRRRSNRLSQIQKHLLTVGVDVASVSSKSPKRSKEKDMENINLNEESFTTDSPKKKESSKNKMKEENELLGDESESRKTASLSLDSAQNSLNDCDIKEDNHTENNHISETPLKDSNDSSLKAREDEPNQVNTPATCQTNNDFAILDKGISLSKSPNFSKPVSGLENSPPSVAEPKPVESENNSNICRLLPSINSVAFSTDPEATSEAGTVKDITPIGLEETSIEPLEISESVGNHKVNEKDNIESVEINNIITVSHPKNDYGHPSKQEANYEGDLEYAMDLSVKKNADEELGNKVLCARKHINNPPIGHQTKPFDSGVVVDKCTVPKVSSETHLCRSSITDSEVKIRTQLTPELFQNVFGVTLSPDRFKKVAELISIIEPNETSSAIPSEHNAFNDLNDEKNEDIKTENIDSIEMNSLQEELKEESFEIKSECDSDNRKEAIKPTKGKAGKKKKKPKPKPQVPKEDKSNRNIAQKQKRKYKNELDRLQDDISKYHDSEAIAAASGLRLCRLQKEKVQNSVIPVQSSIQNQQNSKKKTTKKSTPVIEESDNSDDSDSSDSDPFNLLSQKLKSKYEPMILENEARLRREKEDETNKLTAVTSTSIEISSKLTCSNKTQENDKFLEVKQHASLLPKESLLVKNEKKSKQDDVTTNCVQLRVESNSGDSTGHQISSIIPVKVVIHRTEVSKSDYANSDLVVQSTDDHNEMLSSIKNNTEVYCREKSKTSDEKNNSNSEDELRHKTLSHGILHKYGFKIHKKKNFWKSGIIRKKTKPKKPTNPELIHTPESDDQLLESDDNCETCDSEDVMIGEPPDKDYFQEGELKVTKCKLCPFSGKTIVSHYAITHPKDEVLISRMSPKATEETIKESKKYFMLSKAKRQNISVFKCRICCQMYKKFCSFFEHMALHSGEFRHECCKCGYRTSTRSGILKHNLTHGKNASKATCRVLYKEPLDRTYVGGYLCLDCNFFQICQSNVKRHIENSHNTSDFSRIVKINFSKLSSKDICIAADSTKRNKLAEPSNLPINYRTSQKKPAKSKCKKVFPDDQLQMSEDQTLKERSVEVSVHSKIEADISLIKNKCSSEQLDTVENDEFALKSCTQVLNNNTTDQSKSENEQSKEDKDCESSNSAEIETLVKESQQETQKIEEGCFELSLALANHTEFIENKVLTSYKQKCEEAFAAITSRSNKNHKEDIIKSLAMKQNMEENNSNNVYTLTDLIGTKRKEKAVPLDIKENPVSLDMMDIDIQLNDNNVEKNGQAPTRRQLPDRTCKGSLKSRESDTDVNIEEDYLDYFQNVDEPGNGIVEETSIEDADQMENLNIKKIPTLYDNQVERCREFLSKDYNYEPKLVHYVSSLPMNSNMSEFKYVVNNIINTKFTLDPPDSNEISVGDFKVTHTNNDEFIFMCSGRSLNIQCKFQTQSLETFGQHIKLFHQHNYWDGSCGSCPVIFITDFESHDKSVVNTQSKAFCHLVNKHLTFPMLTTEDSGNITVKEENEDEPARPMLRVRRLSGDMLSTPGPDTENCLIQPQKEVSGLTVEDSMDSVDSDTILIPILHEQNFKIPLTDIDAVPGPSSTDPSSVPVHKTLETPRRKRHQLSPKLPRKQNKPAETRLRPILPRLPAPVLPQLPAPGSGPAPVLPRIPDPALSRLPASSPIRLIPVSHQFQLPDNRRLPNNNQYTHLSTVKEHKTLSVYNDMCTHSKLRFFYKCMGYGCNFTTMYSKRFAFHFDSHKDMLKSNPIDQHIVDQHMDNWKLCAYCLTSHNTSKEICVHMRKEHGECTLQCGHCFYRAKCIANVHFHHGTEHATLGFCVLQCEQKELNLPPDVEKPFTDFVLPFRCCKEGCNLFTYMLDSYCHHLVTVHGTDLSCHICFKEYNSVIVLLEHYRECHGIALFQCLYCVFGASTEHELRLHLCYKHPGTTPKAIQRTDGSGKPSANLSAVGLHNRESLRRIVFYKDQDKLLKYVVPLPEDETSLSSETTSQLQCITSLPSSERDSVQVVDEPKGPVTYTLSPVSRTPLRPTILRKGNLTTVKRLFPLDVSPQKVFIGSSPPTSGGMTVVPIRMTAVSPSKSPSKMSLNSTGRNMISFSQGVCKSALTTNAKITPIPSSSQAFIPISVQNEALPLNHSRSSVITSSASSIIPKSREVVVSVPTTLTSTSTVITPVASPCFLNNRSVTPTSNSDDSSSCKASASADRNNYTSTGFVKTDPNSDITRSSEVLATQESLYYFRCGNKDCSFETGTSLALKKHLVVCDQARLTQRLTCVFCKRTFKQAASLVDHLRVHGPHRFSCALCQFKGPIQSRITSHMKTIHHVSSTQLIPVDTLKQDLEKDLFIITPKEKRSRTNEKTITKGKHEWTKTKFRPEDVEEIPKAAIFQNPLGCSLCQYETKVRSNLIRHVVQHASGDSVSQEEVVNPVPNKQEKMFDKMMNLAGSSHNKKKDNQDLDETVDVDCQFKYVTDQFRYMCHLKECGYRTLSETMLRSHVTIIHKDDAYYACPHCPEDAVPIPIDQLGLHLKLHDCPLFKCSYCSFYSHIKRSIERHQAVMHSTEVMSVQVVRMTKPDVPLERLVINPAPEQHDEQAGEEWFCCITCGFRTKKKKAILAHGVTDHQLTKPYKCSVCNYTSATDSIFSIHFKTYHPEKELCEVITFFKKVTDGKKLVSIPPLWKRDAKKIKLIRGIKLDERGDAPPPVATCVDGDISKLDILEFKFGAFGEPAPDGVFVCPRCPTFQVKSRQDMREHLFKDLEYKPLTCTICKIAGTQKAKLTKHINKSHGIEWDKAASYIEITTNKDVENWVDKVLSTQHDLMKDLPKLPCETVSSITFGKKRRRSSLDGKMVDQRSISVAIASAEDEATNVINPLPSTSPALADDAPPTSIDKSGDPDLSASLESTSSLSGGSDEGMESNNEKKRRDKCPSRHRFSCDYCQLTAKYKNSIASHIKKVHPTMPSKIIPLTKSPIDDKTDAYNCMYCNCTALDFSNLKHHWALTHKLRNLNFMFKKSNIYPELDYECFYCKKRSVVETLAEHCKVDHPELRFLVISITVPKYKCTHCKLAFSSVDILKRHFAIDHPTNQFCYIVVHTQKPTPPEETMPSSCTVVKMRKHPNILSYKCFDCHFVSSKFCYLAKHMQRHFVTYACTQCDSLFSSALSVGSHMYSKHPGSEVSPVVLKGSDKDIENAKRNIIVILESGKRRKITKEELSVVENEENINEQNVGINSNDKPPEVKDYLPPIVKETARKSTGSQKHSESPKRESGSPKQVNHPSPRPTQRIPSKHKRSLYNNRRKKLNLNNVLVSISSQGKNIKLPVEKLRQLVNFDVTLSLEQNTLQQT